MTTTTTAKSPFTHAALDAALKAAKFRYQTKRPGRWEHKSSGDSVSIYQGRAELSLGGRMERMDCDEAVKALAAHLKAPKPAPAAPQASEPAVAEATAAVVAAAAPAPRPKLVVVDVAAGESEDDAEARHHGKAAPPPMVADVSLMGLSRAAAVMAVDAAGEDHGAHSLAVWYEASGRLVLQRRLDGETVEVVLPARPCVHGTLRVIRVSPSALEAALAPWLLKGESGTVRVSVVQGALELRIMGSPVVKSVPGTMVERPASIHSIDRRGGAKAIMASELLEAAMDSASLHGTVVLRGRWLSGHRFVAGVEVAGFATELPESPLTGDDSVDLTGQRKGAVWATFAKGLDAFVPLLGMPATLQMHRDELLAEGRSDLGTVSVLVRVGTHPGVRPAMGPAGSRITLPLEGLAGVMEAVASGDLLLTADGTGVLTVSGSGVATPVIGSPLGQGDGWRLSLSPAGAERTLLHLECFPEDTGVLGKSGDTLVLEQAGNALRRAWVLGLPEAVQPAAPAPKAKRQRKAKA